MYISKYLELLRFYLTDKYSDINNSLKHTLADDVGEICAAIFSAIISFLVSYEGISASGFGGTFLRVVLFVVLFFGIKHVVYRITLLCRTRKEIKQSDKKELTSSESKAYVDKFDHIACDGILLARDFLKKQKKAKDNLNESDFCLIEAFYYYKKAAGVAQDIVQYHTACVNNANNGDGVALYRLINVYKSLCEIHDGIEKALKDSNMEEKQVFEYDLTSTATGELTIIGEFIENRLKQNM